MTLLYSLAAFGPIELRRSWQYRHVAGRIAPPRSSQHELKRISSRAVPP